VALATQGIAKVGRWLVPAGVQKQWFLNSIALAPRCQWHRPIIARWEGIRLCTIALATAWNEVVPFIGKPSIVINCISTIRLVSTGMPERAIVINVEPGHACSEFLLAVSAFLMEQL
jgi:hypothetical protein